MNVKAGGKRESAKAERKENLYEAALELLRAQGYDQTTVDQITQRAGLAKGTFFNYFPTKDAVLRYLGTREIGRLSHVVLMAGGENTSPIGKLKRLMRALAGSLEDGRDLVCLLFSQGVSVSDLLAGDAGGFSLRSLSALLIGQAQRAGEVNPELNPDMLAAALDALYLQQVVLWCESDVPYPLADRLSGVVDLLMMGIANPQLTSTRRPPA